MSIKKHPYVFMKRRDALNKTFVTLKEPTICFYTFFRSTSGNRHW